jgi:glucokinase
MAAQPLEAVGVDIGGTKIAAMRVSAEGGILDQTLVHTPAEDPEEFVEVVIEQARTHVGERVGAIGVGVTGLVDFAAGTLSYGPNLPFRNVPLRGRIQEATGLPCLVDNDANVAAWGEYRVGAGRGATDMLMVTVGTGIGGGIVAGGRMFRGAHGFGAEIGHIIVEPNGPLCGCGNRGCWEQVAAGRAIDRLGRDAAGANPTSLMVRLAGGSPAAVTGLVVVQAAQQGDTVAIGVLAEVGRRLGEGIAGMINILDPEVVVVGGGAISAGELLLQPAREVVRTAIMAPEFRPEVPVVPALMGNAAGGIGAALLALDEVLATA